MNKKIKKETGKLVSFISIISLFFLFLQFTVNSTYAVGTAPVMTFIDNVEIGPVTSDTIIVNVTDDNIDPNTLRYALQDPNFNTCENSVFNNGTLYQSDVPVIFDSHNAGNNVLMCFQAIDFDGNRSVLTSNFLNVIPLDLPTLELNGAASISVEAGTAYIDEGAQYTDDTDGTGSLVAVGSVNTAQLGIYTLLYSYTNSLGAISETLTRTVTVADTTVPILTILGDNPTTVEAGSIYVDQGSECIDEFEGLLPVDYDNSIDTSILGEQTLFIFCEDSSENFSDDYIPTHFRTVFVVDTTAPALPVVTSPLESSIISTNTPTITGNGDGGDTIDITIGVNSYTGVVDGSGNWSVIITNPLAESNNTIQVTETDPNLNISEVSTVNFVVSTSVDTDGDLVPDSIEIAQGTDPSNSGDFLDTDGDGTTDFVDINDDGDSLNDWVENAAPNSGDANNDGIIDSSQGDVSSLVSSITNDYVSLDVTSGTSSCDAANFDIVSESSLATQDSIYDYPVGLNDFTLNCAATGSTVNVKVYYDKAYDTSSWVYSKYNTTTDDYLDMSSIVTYTVENVGGIDVTVVNYAITDGGAYDEDGLANGTIIDPSGPAVDPIINTFPVCGEGLGSWLEEGDKIKIDSKKLNKRVKFDFLLKRYIKKTSSNEDIDENDQNDEYDNENNTDPYIEGIRESTLIRILTSKYNQCYESVGTETFIPKKYIKDVEKLLDTLGDITDSDKKELIILISYARMQNMKDSNPEDLKLVNLINYLQMRIAIEYFN